MRPHLSCLMQLSAMLSFILCIPRTTTAQFVEAVTSIPGVERCTVAWGDYDSDDDLDVLITGWTGSTHLTNIYRNDGSGTFTNSVSLTGVDQLGAQWGDYDNDGDLDLAMGGSWGGGQITRIYRNDGSETFTDIGAGLPQTSRGDMAWGDYDNDGDLDLLLLGDDGSRYCRIYRNDGSDTFTLAVSLASINYGAVAWGDYDNDGDLDVLLAGTTGSSRVTRIYRNDGSDIFTNINAGLPGLWYCDMAWGDYDQDGDLDVLMAGRYGSTPTTRIYRNDGSDTFTDIGAGLLGVERCSVAWGDYDNDGDLDAVLAGSSGSTDTTVVYRNDGSDTFTDIGAGLPGVSVCAVAWGDYDNDGDLDILLAGDAGGTDMTRIYRNDGAVFNSVPAVPTNLAASYSDSVVTLSWDRSGDTETATAGLTYNIYIGTSPGGKDIVSPMADMGTGWRRLPALGNTNHDTTWVIQDLSYDTYYWSVQAIDNAFAGSAFAAEDAFGAPDVTTAEVTDITPSSAMCGGDVIYEGESPVTAKGVVWGSTEDPTIDSNSGMTNDGSGPGAYVSTITGLLPEQTYHVRAYATNADTTAYGVDRMFSAAFVPPGNCLDFDGIDDYVDVTQNIGLPIYTNGTDDNYTVSMWVKGGTQSGRQVYSEGLSLSNNPIFIIGTETGGGDGVRLYIRDNDDVENLVANSTSSVFDNTWHHIAWVDESGNGKLYVDGLLDATDFTYTRSTLNLDLTSIGAVLRAVPSHHFLGNIDEVRVWNYGRAQVEIQDDMNRILDGNESGLVAYFRFDHRSGSTLVDGTGNGNHGTLMNMDDSDWIGSSASIGHESHVGFGTSGMTEDSEVSVDLSWDDDPGSGAIFAAIQVNDSPDVSTGLPIPVHQTYWELWIAHDDASWQVDGTFHYDNLSDIADESELRLYTRTAPGQSWSIVGSTTTNNEGNSTDGIGSLTADDLTAFSQFIIGGAFNMSLSGSVQLDTLILEWSTVPPASAYWIYGAFNDAFFDPQVESPFGYRQAVTTDTTWSGPAGIADPDTNWTYQVIAVDGSDNELGRTNRFGEHEFMLP